eukprot:TRINITY_DN12097_c0_g1_i1.p1 TRINITY_DN12097_c0_g1~~TRINITY_DN12097_c0_g1_i1.p1  ORF type:complete len:319 (+),score=64.78 TRINITY_DN12097_c0_g1_i1:227-1183(+)
MRKPPTWGGHIELSAMSNYFRVNFAIYSQGNDFEVDNEFSNLYRLCFSHGNHYDIVYLKEHFATLSFCQGIVLDIVEEALNPSATEKDIKIVAEHNYQNIGWDTWIQSLKDQEITDREIALATSLEIKKDNGKNNPKKSVWKRKTDIIDEEMEAAEAIRQVEMFKEKEIETNLHGAYFPSLPSKKSSSTGVPSSPQQTPPPQHSSSSNEPHSSPTTIEQHDARLNSIKFGTLSDQTLQIKSTVVFKTIEADNHLANLTATQIKNRFASKRATLGKFNSPVEQVPTKPKNQNATFKRILPSYVQGNESAHLDVKFGLFE